MPHDCCLVTPSCVRRHKIELFGELADEAAAKLRKGQQIALHGRLRVCSAAIVYTCSLGHCLHHGRRLNLYVSHEIRSVVHVKEQVDRHDTTKCCLNKWTGMTHRSAVSTKPSRNVTALCNAMPQMVTWNDRETGQPRSAPKVVADQLAIVKPYSVRLTDAMDECIVSVSSPCGP